MLHADFVHLHLHTNYSLLDGACRITPLIKRAVELKFPALAMTDHGNMFGAIEFYEICMKQGIKPIIGVEAYIAPKSRFDRGGTGIKDTNAHLVLLAKDETGYANLMRLVSLGYLEGFYYKPRIDKEILARHKEGLLMLTSCLSGVLNVHLKQDQYDLARRELDDYVQILGSDNVYIELHDHHIPLEQKIRPHLLRLAKDAGLKCVATNDVHYIEQAHAQAHDALMAIQTQTTLDDPHRLRYEQPEFYLKSAEEMKALFADLPEAIHATLEIADKCNVELEFGKIHLPHYEPPAGKTQQDYLRELCAQGLQGRYPQMTDVLQQRLDTELAVIQQAGYNSYFLIVWDFVRFAKEQGIPVGPGRGSAAGSLVSYCLGITDIDPLKYDLLFERFLNPARVTQPDIDIDFCYERRGEVIDYVIQKYGKTNVAQIITFGTMQAKAVVRDVARVMKISYGEADRLAKLIPNELDITLTRALQEVAELAYLYKTSEQVKELMDTALVLEGLTRHASTHAAGITIADKPLTEYTPLFKSHDDQITTGFDMTSLEHIGILKMDMLGLRTLTVIQEAVNLAERTRNLLINLENLPTEDIATFQLLARAETMGVFQLESGGMRDLLKKIKPSQFEDIISVIALFRPGPIGSGMLDEFMKRKHGQIPIKYDHPKLEPILKSTYGVCVYQEQVMRMASDLAGFSMAQADLLRRAMGKKIAEVMEAQRKAFVEGCKKNNVPEKTATRTFDLIEHFAGYGFNKCVVGETELVDADTGQLMSVQALYASPRPMRTLSVDGELRLVKRPIRRVVTNGKKSVFRVTTHLGHAITVTDTHPFLTMRGWQELKALQPGEAVAVPRSLAGLTTAQRVEPHRLITLAAVLSEGNTCHPSGVYVYNNDKTFIDDFVTAAAQFENTQPTSNRRQGLYEVYAGTGQVTTFVAGHTPWNKGCSGYRRRGAQTVSSPALRSGLRQWIETLGLTWVKATEKMIPPFVFQLPEEQLALFLGRLWSGDGHWGTPGGPRLPFYATSSRRLAVQVQHLLLRLGVLSTLKVKQFRYRGSYRTGLVIYVCGREPILRLLDQLEPHVVGREAQVRDLRAHYQQVPADQSSKDIVPMEVADLVRTLKQQAGLTWHQLEQRSGVSMRMFVGAWPKTVKQGFRRSTIQRLGEYFESPELLRYAASDVYWDRIRTIEPLGEQETYDLEVEDTHNFVANNILVHNSHSAAYAMISYRTAYLKAHYPVEFMTALLTSEMGNTDKLVAYLEEAKRMGLGVLPPDVNESEAIFSVVDERTIRCGLGVIKNVGMGAVESLIAARRAEGPFDSIKELCYRADLRLVNRKVCESLIKAGACDSLRLSRAALLANLDQAMEEANSAQKDKSRGQLTFFEALTASEPPPAVSAAPSPRLRDWPESQKLAFEKELLGFYVSGHPLARFERYIAALATTATPQLPQRGEGEIITIGGMFTTIKQTVTKKTNEQMAVCMLEDLGGDAEVIVFPASYNQLNPQLKPNAIVIVEARVAIRDDEPRLIAQQILPIEQAAGKLLQSVELILRAHSGHKVQVEQLKALLSRAPGGLPVYLRLEVPGAEAPTRLRLPDAFKIELRQDLLEQLYQLLGEDAVVLTRQPLKAVLPPYFKPRFRAIPGDE